MSRSEEKNQLYDLSAFLVGVQAGVANSCINLTSSPLCALSGVVLSRCADGKGDSMTNLMK